MADHLFSPWTLRSLTLRNRIGVSPMCQYSSDDGFASDWHLVHLGSRAIGGAGLVMVEATAVEARGRISPQDMGLWKDEHIPSLARIAAFIRAYGAVPAIQLAHAGRKASVRRPWEGGTSIPENAGGWKPIAPSALPFRATDTVPDALSEQELADVTAAFVASTRRALAAGFELIEIHSAHGYLFHEFLSPLSNKRTDRYGGSFENRTRLLCDTVKAVRAEWPEQLPLFVRVSCTDWIPSGWDIDECVQLSAKLRGIGVDLIDCSSGGLDITQHIPLLPGYQVPFAERIRRDAGIPTGAVGLITEAKQADAIIREGHADLVFLARELLRDPYWPLHAARELGVTPAAPPQYARAF